MCPQGFCTFRGAYYKIPKKRFTLASCCLHGCVSVVLSSDDEEGGDVSRGCSQVCTLVAVKDAVIKGQSSQEAEDKQQHTAGMQVSRVCSVQHKHISYVISVFIIPLYLLFLFYIVQKTTSHMPLN